MCPFFPPGPCFFSYFLCHIALGLSAPFCPCRPARYTRDEQASRGGNCEGFLLRFGALYGQCVSQRMQRVGTMAVYLNKESLGPNGLPGTNDVEDRAMRLSAAVLSTRSMTVSVMFACWSASAIAANSARVLVA